MTPWCILIAGMNDFFDINTLVFTITFVFKRFKLHRIMLINKLLLRNVFSCMIYSFCFQRNLNDKNIRKEIATT